MILVVSGQIAAGKTTLAVEAARRSQGTVIRVREALAEILGVLPDDRRGMQTGGADLDRRTNGRWLAEFVAERAETGRLLVVDSARTVRQTRPLLERLEDCSLVFLRAHESTRRARYARAAESDRLKAAVPFEIAMNHPTERLVDRVASLADIQIETDELTSAQVIDELAHIVRL